MRTPLFLILGALGVVATACGSSSSSGTGGAHTTSTTTTTSSSTHMNMCVLMTDMGNANGVGAYCSPQGGQCSKFPLATACLADLGQSEWFCTRIGCQTDSDCGAMATCVMQSGGAACVPDKCLQSGTGGGGTGGGAISDAGSDGG